jgi:alkanesulfonate monooxygenase SsuD/methylene tetrahydromethanopterin reductase-like flavin-dependent oxidoreductase (luciferase family)
MRLGIGLPDNLGVSGETLIAWIGRVDESPFETLAVVDEIVSHSYEGMIKLAVAAAITRHTRLMSTVIAGPLRNSALLAKQAASIDALCGGGSRSGWVSATSSKTSRPSVSRCAVAESASTSSWPV